MVPSGWGSTSTKRLVAPGTGANTETPRPGRLSLRSTRWVPRLGRSSTSSTRSPAQTPVALTTAFARTVPVTPVSSSRRSTEVPVAASTRARVRTWAPYDAAVRAIVVTRRASSSSWPSQDSTPPRSPGARRAGTSWRASVAETRRGAGRVSAEVCAPRRSRSPAISPPRVTAACLRVTAELTGSRIGIARARCGAVTSIRMPRSTALSWATATWPLAR